MPYDMLILPRSDPGDAVSLTRRTRTCDMCLSTLTVRGGRLPYGPLPRVILAWIWTQASRDIAVAFADPFLDFAAACGADHRETHLLDQLQRLANSALVLTRRPVHNASRVGRSVSSMPLAETVWAAKLGPVAERIERITICPTIAQYMRVHGLVVETEVVRALLGSCLALDLYLWLAHHCYAHRDPFTLPWRRMYELFESQPVLAPAPEALEAFRGEALHALSAVGAAWPELHFLVDADTLTVSPILVAEEEFEFA